MCESDTGKAKSDPGNDDARQHMSGGSVTRSRMMVGSILTDEVVVAVSKVTERETDAHTFERGALLEAMSRESVIGELLDARAAGREKAAAAAMVGDEAAAVDEAEGNEAEGNEAEVEAHPVEAGKGAEPGKAASGASGGDEARGDGGDVSVDGGAAVAMQALEEEEDMDVSAVDMENALTGGGDVLRSSGAASATLVIRI